MTDGKKPASVPLGDSADLHQFQDRVRELAESEDDPAGTSPEEHLRERLVLYEKVNRAINDLLFGKFAYFMNFGYVPDDEIPTYAVVATQEGEFDLNSRRLVLETLGDCPVDGADVLDVSCGRGAVPVLLAKHFRPRSYLGIDFSPEAVAFCQQRHAREGVVFEQGNAESLPVEDQSVDVVVNIEASHLYHNRLRYYGDVNRVLRPGGWFQYTDIMSPDSFAKGVEYLCGLGLEMTRDVDITRNILHSCDDTAVRRLKVYQNEDDRAYMAEFLAAPGSEMYTHMTAGSLRYRLFTFRKPTV